MATDLNTLDPASTDSSTAPRAERIPAVALVAVYCALLLLIPSKLIVRQIGAAGTPATLWGLMLLLWWVCALAGGQLSTRGRSPVRIGIGLLGVAVLLSYCAAMTRGWYAPSDVRQATDDVYDLVPASVQQVRSAMILAADRGLLAFGAWVGVCLVTVDGLRDWADVHRLLAWICGIATIVAGIATLQFFTGMNIAGFFSIPGLTASYEFGAVDQRSVVRRVYATANHPIEFGVLMATIFPLALHSAIFHAKERRWWIPAALVGFGVTISVSRSAILVLVVGMVTLIVSWPQRWRRNLFLSLPFAIVFVRAMAPGVVGTIRSLFTNLGNDPSVSGRTDDYEVAFRLIGDSPVFGRGLFTFVPRYYRILDNQLLTIALEIGYLGLAAFLGLSLVAIASARGARRRSPDSGKPSSRARRVRFAERDRGELRDIRRVGIPDGGRTHVRPDRNRRSDVEDRAPRANRGLLRVRSGRRVRGRGSFTTRRREICLMLANIVRAFINSIGARFARPTPGSLGAATGVRRRHSRLEHPGALLLRRTGHR